VSVVAEPTVGDAALILRRESFAQKVTNFEEITLSFWERIG
jgi:hypothetical protein